MAAGQRRETLGLAGDMTRFDPATIASHTDEPQSRCSEQMRKLWLSAVDPTLHRRLAWCNSLRSYKTAHEPRITFVGRRALRNGKEEPWNTVNRHCVATVHGRKKIDGLSCNGAGRRRFVRKHAMSSSR
jgi:hypothetical protein